MRQSCVVTLITEEPYEGNLHVRLCRALHNRTYVECLVMWSQGQHILLERVSFLRLQ